MFHRTLEPEERRILNRVWLVAVILIVATHGPMSIVVLLLATFFSFDYIEERDVERRRNESR